MGKPRLLDLFCGAGGSARGYMDAGFHVTGIDIVDQPNYCGDDFMRADVIASFPFECLDGTPYFIVDAIHASPPCQAYSVTKGLHGNEYPDLVARVRKLLNAARVPYVIENVVGAPLVNAIRLCGSSFGLGVRRHRLFECKPMLIGVPPCAHHLQPEPIDVTGTGGPTLSNERHGNGGIHRKPKNLAHAREAMGIDWMSRAELSEAVPPAYTNWIGSQLLDVLALNS